MPRGIRRVDIDVLRSTELKAAIVDAVQECGRLQGWANADGNTSLEVWRRRVLKDGLFAPVSVYEWMRTDKKKTNWTVEPLLTLAKIMAHYGVMVDGSPLPSDYFVSILAHGEYKELHDTDRTDKSSPQWLKESLKRMDEPDRLEMLAWLAKYTSREGVKQQRKKLLTKK